MRNILMSFVMEKDKVNLLPTCLRHVSIDRLLMILVRINTWLERDESVLILLLQQYPEYANHYGNMVSSIQDNVWI